MYTIYLYVYIVRVRRDRANKYAEFPQLVSAMRMSSGECLKFVLLLYYLIN